MPIYLSKSIDVLTSPKVVIPATTLVCNIFSTYILRKERYDNHAKDAAIFSGCCLVAQCINTNRKLNILIGLISIVSIPTILKQINKNPQTIEDAIKQKDLKAIIRFGKLKKIQGKSIIDLLKKNYGEDNFKKACDQLFADYTPPSPGHRELRNSAKPPEPEPKAKIVIFELLVRYGANLDAIDDSGTTFIHQLAKSWNRNENTLFAFLSEHAKFDATILDAEGLTPLHYAVCRLNTKLSDLLLKNSADVSAKDQEGATPLHYAACEHNTNLSDLLLKNGADVSAKDQEGATPLHYAACEHNTNLSDLLLKNGADVNAKDQKGATPLHYYAKKLNNDTSYFEYLKKNGADVDAVDNNGAPPFFYAGPNPNQSKLLAMTAPGMVQEGVTLRKTDIEGKDLLDYILNTLNTPFLDDTEELVKKLHHLLDHYNNELEQDSWKRCLNKILTGLWKFPDKVSDGYSIIFKIIEKQKIDILEFFKEYTPFHFYKKKHYVLLNYADSVTSLLRFISENLESEALRNTFDSEKLRDILNVKKENKTILELIIDEHQSTLSNQQEKQQLNQLITTLKRLSGISTLVKSANY